MPGRYALIAAPPEDPDATALAGLLADPARGAFTVETAHSVEAVTRFLAERAPADVVLVHADGVSLDLAVCRSTHVLVLATDREAPEAGPGQAVIAGAPTRAVVRALRNGRTDGNADDDVTATELHNRLAHTLRLDFSDELDTPFVVAQVPRRRRRGTPPSLEWDARKERDCLLGGTVALTLSLPLAWFFGATGLEYAFGAGTAWPNRVAPLVCAVLALAALAQLLTRRAGGVVAVVGGAAAGAVFGFSTRFAEPDLGLGLVFAGVGIVLALVGVRSAIAERTDDVGVMGVGVALVAYQVVGHRNWVWIVLGAALTAGGAWHSLRNR